MTFLRDETAGQLGRAIAARCGGNLAANVRLGNQYVVFYYTRRNKEQIMLTAPLSSDR
jgi:hypothetical protein